MLMPLENNFAVFKDRFITEGSRSILVNRNREERTDFSLVKALNESEQTFIEIQPSDDVISIVLIMLSAV